MSDNGVQRAVERWRACYEATDAEGLKALWDPQHERVTYLPTESNTVMTAWDQISAYYDGICAALDVKEWRVWDLVIDVVAEGVAFAVGQTDFRYVVTSQPELGEQYWRGRVSFVFRERAGDWKIVHYEDSTHMAWMAPLVTKAQEHRRAALAEAIRAGDTDTALALVDALATVPNVWELPALAEPEARP